MGLRDCVVTVFGISDAGSCKVCFSRIDVNNSVATCIARNDHHENEHTAYIHFFNIFSSNLPMVDQDASIFLF